MLSGLPFPRCGAPHGCVASSFVRIGEWPFAKGSLRRYNAGDERECTEMPRGKPVSSVRRVGLIPEIVRHVRLGWRLLRDPRISPWLKLIVPGLLLAYVIVPVDLLPDVFPLVGQLDDLAAILLAGKLFVELCPRRIVREHEEAMVRPRERAEPAEEKAGVSVREGPVIEGKYRVLDDGSNH